LRGQYWWWPVGVNMIGQQFYPGLFGFAQLFWGISLGSCHQRGFKDFQHRVFIIQWLASLGGMLGSGGIKSNQLLHILSGHLTRRIGSRDLGPPWYRPTHGAIRLWGLDDIAGPGFVFLSLRPRHPQPLPQHLD